MEEYVLEMKGICKQYGGIHALTNVSIGLKRGEVLCLCGENGAGKSTLMKILTGVETPTKGEIYLNGRRVYISKPLDAYRNGISIVHQELVQIPEMTIAENIFVGRYEKKAGFIDYKALRDKTVSLMKKLEIYYDPDTKIRQYSVAQRQLIEIMKALSYDSSIIVLDEPTAALTIDETETLYRIIRTLKNKGVSVIFISHRMDDIFAVGDRVYVLKDGKFSGIAEVKDIQTQDIIRMMIGRDIGKQFPEKENVPGDEILEVKNLTNNKVRNISFKVRAGEIIYKGQLIKNKSPRDAIKKGFSMVPEDRKDEGLILSSTIQNNILMSVYDRISKFGFLQRKQERTLPDTYMRNLNIKAPNIQVKAGMLSGGNQQKVVIAKCLASEPSIILLDEPTRGVDVGAKAEIYRIINLLACQGYAIIMVSSELPELMGVSDRIIVMHEGRISGEIDTKEATEERIMTLAI